ncbi:MAG: superoxide dismutase [Myxococcota bacterium]|jgi:Fe-Mn family superoxide dismutase|nr:superoxide dismutase [Myxococcota bacterium]
MKRFEHPALGYDTSALEPWIDEATVKLHHGKHHLGYVNGANAALEKLEQARIAGDYAGVKAISRDLAFHASGAVNHALYWTSMGPGGGGEPGGRLYDQILQDFGSYPAFRAQFTAATVQVDGSGWGVLGWDPGTEQLMVFMAEVHQNTTIRGSIPLMLCDVWEHAYYLKYQNRRAEYVDGWFNVLRWDWIGERFERAKG